MRTKIKINGAENRIFFIRLALGSMDNIALKP